MLKQINKPVLNFIERFEQVVIEKPNALACLNKTEQLNYHDLNAKANQLAHYMRTLYNEIEAPIVILLPRSSKFLVALLAIHKQGGCWAPIDINYPDAYIEKIIKEINPHIIVTNQESKLRFSPILPKTRFIDVNDPIIKSQSTINSKAKVYPQNLACIIYTSGSTGTPKGAMIPHQQLSNWLDCLFELLPFNEQEIIAQRASLSFVLALVEILPALLSGSTLVFISQKLSKHPEALIQELRHWQVTRLYLIPSHLQAIIDSVGSKLTLLTSLKHLSIAGEPFDQELMNKAEYYLPNATIWNNYGNTELAHITYFSSQSAHDSEKGNHDRYVPIGIPIKNTRVFVLNEQLESVPHGEIGELCVESIGLTRGYWQAPGLTAERFVANPYSNKVGSLMYRTGDLVKYCNDGNLEYIGREDYEIKIRGHRIDIRQIEAVAISYAGVTSAIVVPWPKKLPVKRLLLYVTVAEGINISIKKLRHHLTKHLPQHLQPTFIHILQTLPKLPNGKVNRLHLLEQGLNLASANNNPPQTPLEKTLAKLWCEALNLNSINLNDNFFELGGDSLIEMQILTQIRQKLGVDLISYSLLEFPTINSLTQWIEYAPHAKESNLQTLNPIPRDQKLLLSYNQLRLWFIQNYRTEQQRSYNIAFSATLRGTLSLQHLCNAFNCLVSRHEIFRTVYKSSAYDNEPVLYIKKEMILDIPLCKVTENEILTEIEAMTNHVFDLQKGPLLQVKLLKLNNQHHVLLFNIHHILFDGWSHTILLREVQALYSASRKNSAPILPHLPIQYSDYAFWQRKQDLSQHLQYWVKTLRGYDDNLELPYDYPIPKNRTWQLGIHYHQFPGTLSQRLSQFSRDNNATLFMTLLSALAILLFQYTGKSDLCIGTTTAGRTDSKLQDLIGFFVNIVVIRINLSNNPSSSDILAQVKHSVLQALKHQATPFEHILNALTIQRDHNKIPLVPVILRHQNFPDANKKTWPLSEKLQLTEIKTLEHSATTDLDFQFYGDGEQLELKLEYAEELFSLVTIQQLIAHYQYILEMLLPADVLL